jgi:hypothetical protein
LQVGKKGEGLKTLLDHETAKAEFVPGATGLDGIEESRQRLPHFMPRKRIGQIGKGWRGGLRRFCRKMSAPERQIVDQPSRAAS